MSSINTKVDYLILINILLILTFPVKFFLTKTYPTVPELQYAVLVLYLLVVLHELSLFPEVNHKVERDSAKGRLKRRVLYSMFQTIALAFLFIAY